jgi:hypothetical protein
MIYLSLDRAEKRKRQENASSPLLCPLSKVAGDTDLFLSPNIWATA